MADFDDLMRDADLALYDEFGDAAVLTQDGTDHEGLTAVLDQNVEVVVDGYVQLVSHVASINACPVRPKPEAVLVIGATTYRVNRFIDSDGFTTRVAVMPE